MKYATFFMLIIASLMSACSGPEAYRLGKQRMEEQDWAAATQAFEQAVKNEPRNVEFQYALKLAKEKSVNAFLSDGAIFLKIQPEKATDSYRKALLVDPSNMRALEQLKFIDQINLLQKLFLDAKQSAAAGRTQDAKIKFRRLLAEDPLNDQARVELKALEEKQGIYDGIQLLDEKLLKPVTLSVSNGNIKMLFEALALSHKLNFVLDRDLKSDALTSVSLRDVPFESAIEQILSANGLDMRIVNSNTVFIYQATAQKYKEHQEMIVRNFFIESADAKEMGNLLKTVLKINDVYVDPKHSVLVVRDTLKNIQAAEKLLAAHDQAEPEVMLEVEIVEFNHSLSSNLGVLFPTQVSWGVANPLTLNALNRLTSTDVNVTGLSSLLQLNLQSQSAITKVLANPKIRIRNREKAKFHVGDKVPVITSTMYPGTLTGATSSSVSYLDVGIKLEFEPVIQLDGQVVIKTILEDSSITDKVVNNGTTAYQLGTRNVSTTLTLRDGETQILAGMIRSDEANTTNQVPGASQIPFFGALFKNPSKSDLKKEILLSITPRVLRNTHRPTDDLLQFNVGTETKSGQNKGILPSAPVPQAVNRAPTTAEPPRQLLTPMVPFGQPSPSPAITTTNTSGTTATPARPSLPAPVPPPAGGLPTFETPPGVGSSGN